MNNQKGEDVVTTFIGGCFTLVILGILFILIASVIT
jgi:hypothetical protein